jgi:hypothetical protein
MSSDPIANSSPIAQVDAALARHRGALLEQRLELRVDGEAGRRLTWMSEMRLTTSSGTAHSSRSPDSARFCCSGDSNAPGSDCPDCPDWPSSRVSMKTRSSWLW